MLFFQTIQYSLYSRNLGLNTLYHLQLHTPHQHVHPVVALLDSSLHVYTFVFLIGCSYYVSQYCRIIQSVTALMSATSTERQEGITSLSEPQIYPQSFRSTSMVSRISARTLHSIEDSTSTSHCLVKNCCHTDNKRPTPIENGWYKESRFQMSLVII